METVRVFELYRHVDVSGVSGTGVVAHGVIWPDGSVAMRWVGDVAMTTVADCIDDVTNIHGHDGRTVVKIRAITEAS